MKYFAAAIGSLVIAQPATAGHIEFYEGNSQGGSLIGTLPDHKATDQNLQNDNFWGSPNDEIRSIKLKWVTPGTTIEVYDSPSGSKAHDWAQIRVKKWVEEINISHLEFNGSNSQYEMFYVKEDGNLDGKVSRIKVYPADPVDPPLPARIRLCLQKVDAFKKKDGTAREWRSQGSNFRTYFPDIMFRKADETTRLRWKINHIRGDDWRDNVLKDDYSQIVMDFDRDLMLVNMALDTKIDDTKLSLLADEIFKDIPAQAKTNKVMMALEAAGRVGARLLDFASQVSEIGGRSAFPYIIEEVVDKYGNTVAECEASKFAAAPRVDGEYGDDVGATAPPPVIRAQAPISTGKYTYIAKFDSEFRQETVLKVGSRVRHCAKGGNECTWGSDSNKPTVKWCGELRKRTGKKITAYGIEGGKMFGVRDIAKCNGLPF